MRSYVVFDIETTGLYIEAWDEPIEIAAVRVVDGAVSDTFHSYIKPYKQISEKITEITGITAETVKDAPNKYKVIPEFSNFIGDDIVVAHNAPFDVILMNFWLCNMKLPLIKSYVCTMKTYVKRNGGFKISLANMCKALNVELDNAHSALWDTMSTAACFAKMLDSAYTPVTIEASELEAYIAFKSRITKCPYYKEVKAFLSDVSYASPEHSRLNRGTIEECTKLFCSFKTPAEAAATLGIKKYEAESVFLDWINPINRNKFPSLLGGKYSYLTLQEILRYSDWDVKTAINTHEQLFMLPASRFKYMLGKKLLSGLETFKYSLKDFEYYFKNARDMSEISKKSELLERDIYPFFVEWLKQNPDGKVFYGDYIKQRLLDKDELNKVLVARGIGSDIFKKHLAFNDDKLDSIFLTLALYEQNLLGEFNEH